MTKTVTASEARNNFFAILKEVEIPGVSVVITYGGHPKGVLMSVDEFEGWMETLDIMSNPKEAAAIAAGMREKERGEVVTLDEFRETLGLCKPTGSSSSGARRRRRGGSRRGTRNASRRP